LIFFDYGKRIGETGLFPVSPIRFNSDPGGTIIEPINGEFQANL